MGQQVRQNQIIEVFKGDILTLIEADTVPARQDSIMCLVSPLIKNSTGKLGMVVGYPQALDPRNFFEKVLFEDPHPSLNDSITLSSTSQDGAIALVHNGNLPTWIDLEAFLRGKGIDTTGFSDSRMTVEAIAAYMRDGQTLPEAIKSAYPLMTGAFSLLIMSQDKLVAVRDRCGIRPLSLARRQAYLAT